MVDRPARRLRFDRNEWAGAFGDIGTDLPLVVGMLAASPTLETVSVLVLFGAAQILTGLIYGIPMPAQPLKLVAVLTIAQGIGGEVLQGAGLAIALLMFLLTATGLIDRLAHWIPKCVVRGIQIGLGLKLGALALFRYVPSEGAPGLLLAAIGMVVVLVLRRNRRVPAALVVIGIGVVYAFAFKMDMTDVVAAWGPAVPTWHAPSIDAIWTGLWLLALPQLPLSLGNSVLATQQLIRDYFPERTDSVRKIALTYSAMNVVNGLFGGIPTCHGSGGLAGQHAFGARTGGAPVIYGGLYLTLGLFFGGGFSRMAQLFPFPILGVILLFEAAALLFLARDLVRSPARVRSPSRAELPIALTVGLIAFFVPQGFLVGTAVGAILWPLSQRLSRRRTPEPA